MKVDEFKDLLEGRQYQDIKQIICDENKNLPIIFIWLSTSPQIYKYIEDNFDRFEKEFGEDGLYLRQCVWYETKTKGWFIKKKYVGDCEKFYLISLKR